MPAGWYPAEFIEQAVVPLFGLNWQGVPSPVISDSQAPLPDGVYSVRYLANDAASITIELHRFESCNLLQDWPCEEGPYTAADLGVLDVAEGTITLPLDASIGVVIRGQNCAEEIGQGNGADLAALYAAIAADYDVAFGAGLAAGTDPNDMVAALGANPTTGFGIVDAACAGAYGNSVVWKYDGAPTIFVQWPFDYGTGGATDPAVFFSPTAISVSGDDTTLYIYSTFYS